MRALGFIHTATKRAIVAFRGTDLGNAPSAKADECADAMLWNGIAYDNLSSDCRRMWNESTLDYLAKVCRMLFQAFDITLFRI